MSDQTFGFKFILDGTTDITDKIKSFTIESSLESYCRELSFELSDELFYDTLDFSSIPSTARIEVFTSVEMDDPEDEYDIPDPVWISQGLFFIERPTFQVGLNETNTGVWGRQSTAILGEPFAQKITKLWDTDTTFYVICQELIESVGLTWIAANCDIQDFTIYADNFEADDVYPIEALANLVELIVGAEGFVTSDRLGNICIKSLTRAPETSTYDITDLITQSISEEPTWPEFGNRIKIIPSETLSQDKISIFMDNQCLGSGASSAIDVYAQVTNGEGVPINDAVVTWSFDPEIPQSIWYKYPIVGKTALQNTFAMLVSNELTRSTGFSSVDLAFEPSSVIGIWAYADKLRLVNFAPPGGYIIDGKSVLLTEESFAFCDQQVFVSYYSSGMVRNTILYTTAYTEPAGAEPAYGSINVIATVSGREDSKELYVNNSCKCKSTLTVKVDPFSITIGSTQATISAYLENSGVPVTGTIRMVEVSGCGTLAWNVAATSTIDTSENSDAINSVIGQTQCLATSAISSVSGVYTVNDDNVKTSGNLYSSFNGRTIDLNTYVLTGTKLLIEYYRAGSVVNYLQPTVAGVSRIDVSSDVSSEEGLMQTVQVTVQAAPVAPEPEPIPDPGGGGSGGGGGDPVTPPSDTYSVIGPMTCNIGVIDQTFGPWYLAKNGVVVASSMTCSGPGWYRVGVDAQGNPAANRVTFSPQCVGNSYTITCADNAGHSQTMAVNVT